jgi:hypothetical protein
MSRGHGHTGHTSEVPYLMFTWAITLSCVRYIHCSAGHILCPVPSQQYADFLWLRHPASLSTELRSVAVATSSCTGKSTWVHFTPVPYGDRKSTGTHDFLHGIESSLPITVAAPSKAWTVFSRSKAGIVDSNPTQGMDVCVRLFSLCR